MFFINNDDQFQRNKLLCQTCFKTFDGFLGSVVETIGELERYNETIGCHYKLAIVGGQIWRERQKLGRPVQTIAIIVFSSPICSSITIRSEYFSHAITLIRNFSQVLLSIAFTVIKKILLFSSFWTIVLFVFPSPFSPKGFPISSLPGLQWEGRRWNQLPGQSLLHLPPSTFSLGVMDFPEELLALQVF